MRHPVRPLVRCLPLLAVLFLVGLPGRDGAGADEVWPQAYHDSRRSGRSDAAGPGRPRLRTEYPLRGSSILGAPVLEPGGRAYIDVRHCTLPTPDGCFRYFVTVHVLTPDGRVRVLPLERAVQYFAPALGTDGTIYAGSSRGLTALSPAGAPLWTFEASNTGATVTADGTLLTARVDTSGSGSTLFALGPTGALLWNTDLAHAPATSFAVAPDGGIFYGSVDRLLVALSATGEYRWSVSTGDQMHSPPAVGTDGTVYASGATLQALTADGATRWTYAVAGASLSGTTPAIGADGVVYLAGTSLVALDPDTGIERWGVPLAAARASASPVIDGAGTIYVADREGVLAVRPDGALGWRFDVTLPAGVTLAIGADSTLYATAAASVIAIGPR